MNIANDNEAKPSPCPICKKGATLAYRPFCSKRCKLTDLGAWASGAYRLPVPDEQRGTESDDITER